MQKKSARLLIMGLAVTVSLAAASTLLAAPTAGFGRRFSADEPSGAIGEGRGSVGGMEALLNNGVIDQATYDAINDYMEEKRSDLMQSAENFEPEKRREPGKDIMSDMLSEGIITQAEYEAIKAERGTANRAKFSIADILLENELIDQDTYDAITEYVEANRPNVKEIGEEVRAKLASGERPEARNIMAELLENNIITQAQYDEIQAALSEYRNKQQGEGREAFKMGDSFDTLAEKGIISRETADAIKAYMESNMPSLPSSDGFKRINIFSELLEEGIITQAQYDDIQASMPEKPERPMKPE